MPSRWFRSHPALGLYALCLLPRLVLVVGVRIATGVGPKFQYATREGPLWDPFPVHFYDWTAALCGGNDLLQTMLYAGVASLVAPAVWWTGRALGLSRRTALLAGVGVSFYPYYVSTVRFQPACGVDIAVWAGFAGAVARLGVRPSHRRALVAAGTALLLLLDRGESLLFIALLGILTWARSAGRDRKPVLAFGGWVTAGVLLVTLANGLTQGHFTPLPRKTGYNLLLGHNDAIGRYLREDHTINPEYGVRSQVFSAYPSEVDSAATDPRYCDLFRRDALRFARAHPWLTLRNTGYKVLRYWDWRLEDADRQGKLKNLAYAVPYAAAMILGLAGVIVLLRGRQWHPLLFLVGGILVTAVPGLITIPLIRTRMYTEFLLILLAAVGAVGDRGRPPAGRSS